MTSMQCLASKDKNVCSKDLGPKVFSQKPIRACNMCHLETWTS